MPDHQPQGYLAIPATGKGPGVLVLHAWWGLNDTIKTFCNHLAEAGFVVFAPDLYHGKVVDTIPAAEEMVSVLEADPGPAQREIAGAVTFLNQHAAKTGDGLAVVGFSLGAFFALNLATAVPDLIRAIVVFYGTGVYDHGESQAAYLGHFAEHDPFEPTENVDGLEQSLKAFGRPATIHRYPGTGHWFFEPDRADAYNPAAAALAWDRTLDFLQHSVKL